MSEIYYIMGVPTLFFFFFGVEIEFNERSIYSIFRGTSSGFFSASTNEVPFSLQSRKLHKRFEHIIEIVHQQTICGLTKKNNVERNRI